MARPVGTGMKKYKIKNMIKALREYTDNTEKPILKECCLNNEWDYDYFIQLQRENPVLRAEAKRLLLKKEVVLEKALDSGMNNTAFIFELKQLGWKDNPDNLIVNNNIQNNQGGNRSEKLKEVSTELLEQLEDIYNQIDNEIDNSENEQIADK